MYLLTALALSHTTVNTAAAPQQTKTVYLSTNGVHLDIILHREDISHSLRAGLVGDGNYFAFGWGEENFYLNTPTWGDLTVENGFRALFLNSSSLMHVKRWDTPASDWVAVTLSNTQLQQLNQHLAASFQPDARGQKTHLPNAGHLPTSDFYKAKGSYTLFYTCNTWANDMFKRSGLKASYWTPFDMGLLNKYETAGAATAHSSASD